MQNLPLEPVLRHSSPFHKFRSFDWDAQDKIQ